MKQIVRKASGLVMAAAIVTACAERGSTTEGSLRTRSEALSLAPMTWPTDPKWMPIQVNGANIGDPTGDTQGSRDVVGNTANPAVYIAADADRMYFRMRLGSTPLKTLTTLNPFGWACELDTDSNHQTYELIANVNGIVNGDAVLFSQNTTQGTLDSPSDKAETTLQTYSALVDSTQGTTIAHARVLAAGTNLGGKGGDLFIDWAVDLNDFPVSFSPLGSTFRVVCGSSANAQNISSDPVSVSGATTLTGLVSDPITCTTSGCSPACVAESDCSAAQFCNTSSHLCTAKLANGTAIPTIANHTPALTGTCSAPVGTAVCVASVCDVADNKCGLANGDGPCTAGNAATVCRSGACSAGVCVAPGTCAVDGDCQASQFCDTAQSLCVAKLTNGTSIPTITGHVPALTGTCSLAVGTSVCVASVCDTADDKCGLANGDGPCTVGNAGTVCRSTACSPNALKCVPVGGCLVDADCSSNQFCDTSSLACVAKLGSGVSIPTIANHTPALTGTCSAPVGLSVCAAGVCDLTDNACALANGSGPCSVGTAGTVCRSSTCSANAPVCIPAGGCAVDADCGADQFCNTPTLTCQSKLANGTPMPTVTGHVPTLDGTCTVLAGSAVCAAAVCDAKDAKCGLADGTGPCDAGNAAVVCRSGACSATGSVCVPAVSGCATDGDCASNQFCNTVSLTCQTKLANGAPIPTIGGHTPPLVGTCSAPVGAAVCASAVCEATDNLCGKLDGTTCGAPSECRSGVCVGSVCTTPVDAGVDAGADAAVDDAGTDAGSDAAVDDAGTDAGTDAAVDDAGTDAGTDAGDSDAATDAGADAEAVDAGQDAAVTDAAVTDAATVDASKADGGATSDGGKETTTATDGGSPPADDGILEGGGISCNIGSTEGGSAGWGAFAALALTGFVRRRRNRETGR